MSQADCSGWERFSSERVLDFLAKRGYEVSFRWNDWFECLVSGLGEAWLGAGTSRDAALFAALSHAFPSAAARAALASAVEVPLPSAAVEVPLPARGEVAATGRPEGSELGSAPSVVDSTRPQTPSPAEPGTPPPEAGEGKREEGVLPPEASAPLPGQEVPLPARGEVAATGRPEGSELGSAPAEVAATGRPEGSELGSAPSVVDSSRPQTPSPAEPGTPPPGAGEGKGGEVPLPPEAPSPSRREPTYRPKLGEKEAVGELQDLQQLITDSQYELALYSSKRQRYQMQAWVCEARSYEELHYGDDRVHTAATLAVRKLSSLAKVFWPGNINSMRVDASPGQVMPDHGLKGPAPGSWFEAMQIVKAAMDAAAQEDDAKGLDEYGWADARKLVPGPNRPEGLFQEVRSRIEKLTGPVDGKPIPKGVDAELKRPAPALVEELLMLARKLRWLRLAVPENDLIWGQLVGRLRAVAALWGKERGAPLRAILADETAPRKSWSAEIGIDPTKKQKQRKRVSLLNRFKTVQDVGTAEMPGLLVDAFELFNNIELSALLRPAVGTIKALGSEALEERAARRRLALLKKRMDEEPADAKELQQALAAMEAEAAGRGGDAEPDGLSEADPVERLAEQIRVATSGKRALLITNRNDEPLAESLRARLAFSEVGVAICDPRRVTSATQAIGNGSIDFALAVSGFLPHTADGAISDACKKSGTRLVRIGKGRPIGAIRAIGRVLRVDTPSSSAAV